MNDWTKLLICAVASLVLHFGIEQGLQQLPPYVVLLKPRKLKIEVVQPPPPPPEPEPPKPPDDPKPVPKPDVHEAPKPHARVPVATAEPKEAPPPEHPAVTAPEGDEPVFGTTMESTSTAGNGPAVPVGNTARPEVAAGSAAPVKHAAEPVQAFEATKMPMPQGHCYGKYTDDALKAAVEGTVVLDLVVGEDGRVRDLKVVQGLGHGLDEAALAALRDCAFSPGEKDGKPVAVRIRGFKITFVLPEQSDQ